MPKPNLIQEYFDHETSIMDETGHYMTRGEIITYYQKAGWEQKDIDWYLFCLDQKQEKE